MYQPLTQLIFQPKQLYIQTFGCQMNEYDSARVMARSASRRRSHDEGRGLKIEGDRNGLLCLSLRAVEIETTQEEPVLSGQVFSQLRVEPGFDRFLKRDGNT